MGVKNPDPASNHQVKKANLFFFFFLMWIIRDDYNKIKVFCNKVGGGKKKKFTQTL